jgi:hypothetical protein
MPSTQAFKKADSRIDTHMAARVDDALKIVTKDGMNAALEFMQLVGVQRSVAWRVLCFPALCRKGDQRQRLRDETEALSA